MRDFPSCFGDSSLQVADSSAGPTANGNAVTCVYLTRLPDGDRRDRECRMTVVWSKTVLGQVGLSITLSLSPDYADRRISGNDRIVRNKRQLSLLDIKLGPPLLGPLSNSKSNSSSNLNLNSLVKSKLKWNSKGSRTVLLSSKGTNHTPAPQLHVFWDLSAAKFGPGLGPQPSEGFYVAVISDLRMVLLLGDLAEEAYRISGALNPCPSPSSSAICVAKKQHITGRKLYTAQTCFCDGDKCHDIAIECDVTSPSGSKEPCLEIRVDKRRVMKVKRLSWKFRGNQTIVVDGVHIEVLWDVHSWLFGAGTSSNAAVFMFYTAPSTANMPETHLGFSLLLYAWKVR